MHVQEVYLCSKQHIDLDLPIGFHVMSGYPSYYIGHQIIQRKIIKLHLRIIMSWWSSGKRANYETFLKLKTGGLELVVRGRQCFCESSRPSEEVDNRDLPPIVLL